MFKIIPSIFFIISYLFQKKEVRKLIDFGVNLDERIADGYYMAKALQLLQ